MAVSRLSELHLPSLAPGEQNQAKRWTQLGVSALALAGLFALLLVLSRLPVIGEWFPWLGFFRTALVVHVDQSVLIWFLSMAAAIVALSSRHRQRLWDRVAWGLAAFGMLGIAASAFVGEGEALMNNYVPVLQRPLFFISVGSFVLGVSLQFVRSVWGLKQQKGASATLLGTVSWTLLLALMVTLLSFVITAVGLQKTDFSGVSYFEFLFWGAGHNLQFVYTQSLLFAWMVLALASGLVLPGRVKYYQLLVIVGVLPLLSVPGLHFLYESSSLELRTGYTELMRWGSALAAIPLGLVLLWVMFRTRQTPSHVQRPLRRMLWMSWLLFFAGGLIALSIQGVNTIIPAHYHGSIVSVTMALMGLAYVLMPAFGYAPLRGKLADWQPLLYGGGQLMHVLGLALSGAMGMQRKTAGDAQGMEGVLVKITMGVMGLGGVLAVAGGVLFVWVMWRGFSQKAQVRWI